MTTEERESEIAALEGELRTVRDEIDAAYWCFTRQARAKPPVLAVPKAYERRDEINARLKALRAERGSRG